jgi:hypothetical protein
MLIGFTRPSFEVKLPKTDLEPEPVSEPKRLKSEQEPLSGSKRLKSKQEPVSESESKWMKSEKEPKLTSVTTSHVYEWNISSDQISEESDSDDDDFKRWCHEDAMYLAEYYRLSVSIIHLFN